jgi:hypothetical protein
MSPTQMLSGKVSISSLVDRGKKNTDNILSALAALEGTDSAASPPSAASSPPTTKSRPNIEQERSESPDKGKE